MLPSPFSSSPSGSGSSSSLASLLSSSEAEATLVNAIVAHQLKLSRSSLRAAVFLQVYGCDDVVLFLLNLKRYQAGASVLQKSLESVSLKKFMKGVEVSLSNK